jgi:xanthine dehydrogenase accessory factor
MTAKSDPKEISALVRELLESGSRGVLVTLIDGGTNNLRVGAKLIVNESGVRQGSFGQEALEEAVVRHALNFLKTRDDAKAFQVVQFAPDLTEFAKTTILFERIEAEPRLIVAGAGHVGASLARLAALIGYRVTLIDDRAEFVDRKLFSMQEEEAIELVSAHDWQAALRHAIGNGRGVAVAIVTRGHKQDEECLRAAMETDPDYVGMIGSRRRTNIVLDKLREEGANDVQLRKVRAPIGLDIGAVSPEEVALAILAEIVAERRGGSGTPLSDWRRTQS